MECVQREVMYVEIDVCQRKQSLITMIAMAHVLSFQSHVPYHPQHLYHQVFAGYATRNVNYKMYLYFVIVTDQMISTI